MFYSSPSNVWDNIRNNPELEGYSDELLMWKYGNLPKYKKNFEDSNYHIDKL